MPTPAAAAVAVKCALAGLFPSHSPPLSLAPPAPRPGSRCCSADPRPAPPEQPSAHRRHWHWHWHAPSPHHHHHHLRPPPTDPPPPAHAGKQRLVFVAPSRGLIGFKSAFVNLTRGEGLLQRAFLRYGPLKGPMDGVRKGGCLACCARACMRVCVGEGGRPSEGRATHIWAQPQHNACMHTPVFVRPNANSAPGRHGMAARLSPHVSMQARPRSDAGARVAPVAPPARPQV